MSNKVNHRRKGSRNKKHADRPLAYSCGGEGANGVRGRTKWKKITRRQERHAKGERIIKLSYSPNDKRGNPRKKLSI